MNNFSLAGVGLIISVLSFLAKYFQLDVDDGQITEAVNAGSQFVGFVLLVWGQLRRKDLKFGVIRK